MKKEIVQAFTEPEKRRACFRKGLEQKPGLELKGAGTDGIDCIILNENTHITCKKEKFIMQHF